MFVSVKDVFSHTYTQLLHPNESVFLTSSSNVDYMNVQSSGVALSCRIVNQDSRLLIRTGSI